MRSDHSRKRERLADGGTKRARFVAPEGDVGGSEWLESARRADVQHADRRALLPLLSQATLERRAWAVPRILLGAHLQGLPREAAELAVHLYDAALCASAGASCGDPGAELLLGPAAMLVAVKMEECELDVTPLGLMRMFGLAEIPDALMRLRCAEAGLCAALDWRLAAPTPCAFISALQQEGRDVRGALALAGACLLDPYMAAAPYARLVETVLHVRARDEPCGFKSLLRQRVESADRCNHSHE
jgi:hypothetical protein